MTITIDLTPEQESRISAEARAAGIAPAQVVLRLIDDLHPRPTGLLPGETLLDAFMRLGAVGAVEGRPRPDGKPWSECEGLE